MSDTIVAIATPKGIGGVGIVRVSGEKARDIAKKICGRDLPPRYAHYTDFIIDAEHVDSGIAVFFQGPHSFTGEDVLELQGHGGTCVLNMLVEGVVGLGARMARPGEFTERAFLNGKLDLAQAEAVADLIHARTQQAAKSATQSLVGGFSEKINKFAEELLALRVYIEAAIDFPDEDIELLAEGNIVKRFGGLEQAVRALRQQARQGRMLQEGFSVALVGRPNVGKSSIFNMLLDEERAIVSNIEGTTRDILREHIQVEGYPVSILDTAGIRENADLIEQQGILRTHKACKDVEHIFLVVDRLPLTPDEERILSEYEGKISLVVNKVDLMRAPPQTEGVLLCAQSGEGVDDFIGKISEIIGVASNDSPLTARARHIRLLDEVLISMQSARKSLEKGYLECAAQELIEGHEKLGEITGVVTRDDLLGEIFSSFCIGK